MQSIVSKEDLSVVFQPIVDMRNGRQFATEALVRCKLPHLGDPPFLFQQAVANKCTGRLGRIIREIATTTMFTWRSRSQFPSCNSSFATMSFAKCDRAAAFTW